MRWMKEYSESVLRNMQGGVVTVDADRKIVVFNPAAERLTGRPAEEVLGKPLSAIDRGISGPLREALEDGRVYTHQEGILNDHTPPIPIIFSTSLLHDPSGRHGAVMVFSDLSYIRRLEQERSLAERMVLVGTMAAELAHEIKNPLVSIRTFTELLPERHEDPEFRRYFQEVALKELDRINALIAQLSETARPPSFQKAPIDLREVIEYTLMLIEERARKSEVRIVRDYDPGLPQVMGETTRMRQLFLNLLYNALEAMPEGGTLTVSAARGDGTWDGYVEVRIRDTGKGIPEDRLERVFDPFFSTKEGGMGLGLTICRRIVQDFKGDLHLECNPEGRGVTAFVRLPAVDRKEVIGVVGADPHWTP
ncbi:MAG TPA: PAS domain-containing protein [Candidatus Latescibacteria bacterium]|nr:PAS domain-containing protein [Candidatus Latescibacterota bacterium]